MTKGGLLNILHDQHGAAGEYWHPLPSQKTLMFKAHCSQMVRRILCHCFDVIMKFDVFLCSDVGGGHYPGEGVSRTVRERDV